MVRPVLAGALVCVAGLECVLFEHSRLVRAKADNSRASSTEISLERAMTGSKGRTFLDREITRQIRRDIVADRSLSTYAR